MTSNSVLHMIAVAFFLSFFLCSELVAAGSIELASIHSDSVDLSTLSFQFVANTNRALYVERKSQALTIALLLFAAIVVFSCIPCGCLWYTLYKETRGGASWAKPSSLFTVPMGSGPAIPFRPTSPMTYRAAGPSPVVIRQG